MIKLLKYPGSKDALADQLLLLAMPVLQPETVYVAPFVGSAALYWALYPRHAILGDALPPLMEMYQMLAEDAEEVAEHLYALADAYHRLDVDASRETFYYDIRYNFNHAHPGPERAAWFIWLNRCCFNGLVRTNGDGRFNVPWGKRRRVSLPSYGELLEAGRRLQQAHLICGDFEDTVREAPVGALVYADPPYHSEDGSGYTGYTGEGFDEDDQARLARTVRLLTDYGIYCIVSNADTPFIRRLYEGLRVCEVAANRSIAADGKKRGQVQELVVLNFDEQGNLLNPKAKQWSK